MDSLTTNKQDQPRSMRRKADKLFDNIYKYYFSRKTTIQLTDEEETVRERWDFAWKLLANMFTRRQITEALIAKYKLQKSVAYDDVNKAMMLFGDPQNANREAKKVLAEEWITKGIKKAWDNNDMQAYEKLIARYTKINKLEGETGTDLAELAKKFQARMILITSSPEDLWQEAERLKEGIVMDIDHTDLTDESKNAED